MGGKKPAATMSRLTRGFMKALLDARSDRILGFTMLGHEAGEPRDVGERHP
ncbi:MAG: hypothetical protein ABWY64_27445 [Tardiphaga sp.]